MRTTAVAVVCGLLLASGEARAQILIGHAGSSTGPVSWDGTELARGADKAVAQINDAGGVLGQEVRIIRVDDHCDGDQAVAAAHKLVADGVAFVLGHSCSGAAIPASEVYAESGTLMMTDLATNPLLTEQGFANVFRFCGRDDTQGAVAGTYLAHRWAGGKIGILFIGNAYGQGLAEETRKALRRDRVTEVLYEELDSDLLDYSDVIDELEAADIDALYYAGYAAQAALLIGQIRERNDDLEFVAGDGVFNEEFALIAGPAGNGMRFTFYPDAMALPAAAGAIEAFRAEGRDPDNLTLLSYAAVQAWAQAVERAGSLDADRTIEAMRSGTFDTIFGEVGFDAKGDVTGYDPFVWYVWQDGEAVPMNQLD